MKTKKQLLEFFLKKLKLWERFISANALVWAYVDDDLVALDRYYRDNSKSGYFPHNAFCIWDREYLQMLCQKKNLPDCELAQAINELAEYAGLNAYNAGGPLEEQDSVMGIVNKVYKLASCK